MQLDDNASGGVLEAEADGEVKGERGRGARLGGSGPIFEWI